MNYSIQMFKKIAIAAATLTLISCGGGGSATGGNTDFSVLPTSWTLTGSKGNTTCLVNPANLPETTVTIVGGTPPYRIINSSPQNIKVDDTILTGKNPSFKVYSLGGCSSELSILILDNKSRSITFTFTFEAGDEETAAATAPTT